MPDPISNQIYKDLNFILSFKTQNSDQENWYFSADCEGQIKVVASREAVKDERPTVGEMCFGRGSIKPEDAYADRISGSVKNVMEPIRLSVQALEEHASANKVLGSINDAIEVAIKSAN